MRHLFEIQNLKRTKLRVFGSLFLMVFCFLVSTSVSAKNIYYHIRVQTANEKGAASDNDISLNIHGEWGSTGVFNIKGNKAQGGMDEFYVNKKDVGKISKIVLKYKKVISENWKCQYIHITKDSKKYNKNTNKGYYEFNENSWFGGKKIWGTISYDIYPDYTKHAPNNSDYMTDPRDGQRYKTVTINDKIWLAEDIKYDTDGSICRVLDTEDKDLRCKYGRYYDKTSIELVCPDGWRIPKLEEIKNLLSTDPPMEESEQFDYFIDGGPSGFNVKLEGYFVPESMEVGSRLENVWLGKEGGFWVSSDYPPFQVFVLYNEREKGVSYPHPVTPFNKYQCRCVKDVKNIIALKTINNHYLSAHNGGGSSLTSNKTKVGTWETFTMEELGNNKVSLKTHNGHYVVAENGGAVNANRARVGTWETFTKVDLGNNKITLKTHNGQYVVATGGDVSAGSGAVWGGEIFTLETIQENKLPELPTPQAKTIPFYRYYNRGIGDHHFSTGLMPDGKHGYKREGIACEVFATQQPGTVPLYRYFSGSDHHFTINISELGRNGKSGYRFEKIACYVYLNKIPGTIPLYRYYSKGATDHHFTTKKMPDGKHGYKAEGIACYVFPKKQ
ncbi:MAG: FISUMP domain-containing protein [Chitinophagales bacterium]